MVRAAGGDHLADRLERAIEDEVKLLALTIEDRAVMLMALEHAPESLTELRAVLVHDLAWRVDADRHDE